MVRIQVEIHNRKEIEKLEHKKDIIDVACQRREQELKGKLLEMAASP
jgi:hypothetical protein